tara:strand:+ start:203 stop:625 length:423 start_codon:yes stop_codon:yes gene_type:complete
MNIAIASDHGGYKIKQAIVDWLKDQKHIIVDCGCYSEDSCDYPDFAKHVCSLVSDTSADFGILVCGTGIGMSIAANRYSTIRAGLCKDTQTAMLTRKHNNANILCLGARVTDPSWITNIVETFLNTEFEGGRHTNRIKKL